MTIDVSLIPQNRVENLISKLSEIENNIGNIGTDITNNVVHKNGVETISGLKTIENNIFLKDTQGTIGTSTNQWARRIQFADSIGERIARLEPLYVDTTTLQMGMYASNGTTTESGIWVRNTGETYAPHPATAQDSSNKIATTAWVNNLDNSVVHKAGDETIAGTKVLLNNLHIKNSNIEQLTAPGSYNERLLYAVDKNNVRIGSVGFAIDANGRSRTYIESSKVINGTATYGIIESYTDLNGNHSYYIGGNLVKGFVKETWKSGTSWYRIWSDGWIEQGNYSTNKTNTQTVTFYKAFTNIPTLQTTIVTTRGAASHDGEIFPRSISKTNFVFGSRLNDCSGWFWYACGY